jgi:hypothetical protein
LKDVNGSGCDARRAPRIRQRYRNSASRSAGRLIAYRKAVDRDEAVPRALDADRPLLADPHEAPADFMTLRVHNAVREKRGD